MACSIMFNKLQFQSKLVASVGVIALFTSLQFSLYFNDLQKAREFYAYTYNFGGGISLILCLQVLWEYYP